jgi:hypothetical protein
MRNHVRLCASLLLVCAVAYGGYHAFAPASSEGTQASVPNIDPFGTCTEASLDRTSGQTRLGYCPAPGTLTLTAGLH